MDWLKNCSEFSVTLPSKTLEVFEGREPPPGWSRRWFTPSILHKARLKGTIQTISWRRFKWLPSWAGRDKPSLLILGIKKKLFVLQRNPPRKTSWMLQEDFQPFNPAQSRIEGYHWNHLIEMVPMVTLMAREGQALPVVFGDQKSPL